MLPGLRTYAFSDAGLGMRSDQETAYSGGHSTASETSSKFLDLRAQYLQCTCPPTSTVARIGRLFGPRLLSRHFHLSLMLPGFCGRTSYLIWLVSSVIFLPSQQSNGSDCPDVHTLKSNRAFGARFDHLAFFLLDCFLFFWSDPFTLVTGDNHGEDLHERLRMYPIGDTPSAANCSNHNIHFPVALGSVLLRA